MGAIFFFSTDLFASPITGSITEQILRFLFPALSEEWVTRIHMGLRKSAHMSSYAVLSWFYLYGLSRSFSAARDWNRKRALTAVLFSALYALSDEWHQSFSPERTATVRDVGWDGLGAVLGQAYFFIVRRTRAG